MTNPTPFDSTACALIIGINDYHAFDPTGAHNLKGGAHDTVAVARCCTFLGMKADDIHILRNDVESLGNTLVLPAVGDTSQKGIYAEIDWLREQLDAGRHGLFWYSGHGANTKKDGLLVCPSDTTKDFANAIPLKELRERLGPAAEKKLTVVLDCCHGTPQADSMGRPSTTLGGDPITTDAFDVDLRIGAVVLAACAPGELAQQSWFSALPHGAFTWALLSAVNQWVANQVGGNVAMDLTYWQLIKKATLLLDALDFDQTPQIWPQWKGSLPVLGDLGGTTHAHPSANRGHIQLDPLEYGCKYTMTFEGVESSIDIFAAGPTVSNALGVFNAMTEYWNVPSGIDLRGATGISISPTASDRAVAPDGFPVSGTVCMPTSPPSQNATGTPPSSGTGMFYYLDENDSSIAFAVQLSQLPGTVKWWYTGVTLGYLVSATTSSGLTWSSSSDGFPFSNTFNVLALSSYTVPQPANCWQFRDGGGTTAAPSAGSTYGTLGTSASMANDPAWVTVTPSDMNDVNAYVDFGGSVAAFGTADFTISFWYLTNDTTTILGDVIGNRTAGSFGNYVSLRMGPNGNLTSGCLLLELCDDTSGTNYVAIWAQVAVNDGAWHFIAITRTAGQVTLSMDGNSGWSQSTENVNNLTSGVDFKAGRSLPVGEYNFASIKGQYADLRISSGTALTQAQIQEISLSQPTV